MQTAKVYIYMHPDGKQFLFSPEILKSNCEFIEVEGFTDDDLNQNFAHEFNSGNWFEGSDTTRFILARLNEAIQRPKA